LHGAYGEAGRQTDRFSNRRSSLWGGQSRITQLQDATCPPPEVRREIQQVPGFQKKNESRNGRDIPEIRCSRTGGAWASKYGQDINDWDVAPPPEYFEELFRVSKNQIIWGGNYFDLPPSRNFIVWDKQLYLPSMAECEMAWCSINGNAKMFRYPPQDPARFHPTQKPVALYKWLLSRYAKEGMTILDTHMGSGSCAVACLDMGFKFIGSEIDEDYFNAMMERIRLFDSQGRFDFA
jgi:site-specific DNA-methyltransferase (adenine-specific)